VITADSGCPGINVCCFNRSTLNTKTGYDDDDDDDPTHVYNYPYVCQGRFFTSAVLPGNEDSAILVII